MRLRRLMGVADQIVASRFSSIDLGNKANRRIKPRCFVEPDKLFDERILLDKQINPECHYITLRVIE